MSFRLLEPVRNTVASERNPHRDGWYLRTITRQGGMNSGRWAVVLHADGTESETPPGNLVSLGVSRDYCQECPAQMPQVGGGKCAVDCNLRARIATLERQVEQAREALAIVDEQESKPDFAQWLAVRSVVRHALQALREGGENG